MGGENYNLRFNFVYGDLDNKTFWVRSPLNRLFHIDRFTLEVILNLNNGTSIDEICKKYDLSKEEVSVLIQKFQTEGAIDIGAGKIIYEKQSKDIAFYPFVLLLCLLLLIQLIYFCLYAKTSALNSWRDGFMVMAVALGAIFLHELGHFIVARRYFKPKFGFTFLFLFPAIYVDTHEAWCLPRNVRLLISSAGLLSDCLVNTLAIILAISFHLEYFVTPFLLTQYIRLSFVLNPLFPTDGYWMLVDLTRQVNLRKLAFQNLKKLKFNLYSLYSLLSVLMMIMATLGLIQFVFKSLYSLLRRFLNN